MRSYITDIQSRGWALLIGEVGRSDDYDTISGIRTTLQNNHANADTVYAVAPDMGVGILAWHGADGGTFDLVTESDANLAYWAANESFDNLTPFGPATLRSFE